MRASQSFARDELLPHAAAWDATKHFPVDTLRRAAELGFAGIYVREDVGGSVPNANSLSSQLEREQQQPAALCNVAHAHASRLSVLHVLHIAQM